MLEGIYKVEIHYTGSCPSVRYFFYSRISREKILEKLSQIGITEQDLEHFKRENGSYVIPLGNKRLLEIIPIEIRE
jgi:hypothetical protein